VPFRESNWAYSCHMGCTGDTGMVRWIQFNQNRRNHWYLQLSANAIHLYMYTLIFQCHSILISLRWGQTESTWYVGHRLAYRTSPGWRMMMMMMSVVEWQVLEVLGETLPQCHFDQHKSRMTWARTRAAALGSQRLTARVTTFQGPNKTSKYIKGTAVPVLS
jgi:hypothetical protein